MYNRICSFTIISIGLILLLLMPGTRIFTEYGPELETPGQFIALIITIVGFIWIFASVITNMNEGQYQYKRFTRLREYVAMIPILEAYKDNLIKEFKVLLTKEYPEYESGLVSKFSFDANNAESALVALAPALKTSNMYSNYVEKINIAMTEILNNQKRIQNEIQYIQEHYTNPWYWFKVPVPADVSKLTESQIVQ